MFASTISLYSILKQSYHHLLCEHTNMTTMNSIAFFGTNFVEMMIME